MTLLDHLHGDLVYDRRLRVLAEHLDRMLPRGSRVLDVGCGDGRIAQALMALRPDLEIEGIDVLPRERAAVPVRIFDGCTIPFDDSSFDVVMFIDVLHHTDAPQLLLGEAARVSSRSIVIKDHLSDTRLAPHVLRFMDWVGNARHGVRLPYNYWSSEEWSEAFAVLGWRVATEERRLRLYPRGADWLFGRGLHFVARLERRA